MVEMTGSISSSDPPPNIPQALFYDFDISYDPLPKPDIYLGLVELARRTPEMFWTPRYGGH
jgi:hypothetical protein